MFGKEARR